MLASAPLLLSCCLPPDCLALPATYSSHIPPPPSCCIVRHLLASRLPPPPLVVSSTARSPLTYSTSIWLLHSPPCYPCRLVIFHHRGLLIDCCMPALITHRRRCQTPFSPLPPRCRMPTPLSKPLPTATANCPHHFVFCCVHR
jgi:hypothetical protein